MLRTGQPSTYSRHTDYYQLWLENKKEIQKLESNLLDSKKIIRTLHLKLTDILKSIKIFEENQDLNNSNEGQKSSHGSFTILPVNDATIALEVEGDQRNLQNPRSDLVEVNLKQQTQTDNGNATLNILPLTIPPGSVHTTILPESVSASSDSAAYTLVPLGDLGHSNTTSGHDNENKPSNLLENQSEFVEVNFNQDIPVENVGATEPFIALPVSLHSNLEFSGVQNEDINKLEGRRKQKLITKSDLLVLTNVQEEAKTGSTERPDGHHNLPVTLECVKNEPAEELDNNDYIVDNVPEVLLHAGGSQEMVLQGQESASENFNFKNVDFSVFSSLDVACQSVTAYDTIMVLNDGTEGRPSVLPDNIGELLIRDFNKAIQSKNSEDEATCQEMQPLSILANPSRSLCSFTPVEAKEGKDKNVKNLQRKQERTPKRKCNEKFSGQRAYGPTRRNNCVSAEIKLMALERLSKGESQHKIAKDFGVVQSTVAYWVKTVGQNSSFSKEDQRSERNLDSEFIVSSGENSAFPEQRTYETLSRENPEDVTLLFESVKQPIELGSQSHVSTKNPQVPLQRLNDASEADAVERECSHCHNRFIYTEDVSGHPCDTLPLLCGTCKMQTKTITPHLEKPNKNMCSLCGRCFPYPSNLQVHQRKHLRCKPHVCSFCGKRFPRIWHLNRHLRLHTSSKPFIPRRSGTHTESEAF